LTCSFYDYKRTKYVHMSTSFFLGVFTTFYFCQEVHKYDLIQRLIRVGIHVTKIRPRSPLGYERLYVCTHSQKRTQNAIASTLAAGVAGYDDDEHSNCTPPPPIPSCTPLTRAPPRMPPPPTPPCTPPLMTTPRQPPASTPHHTPEIDNDGSAGLHRI
jgi:hypothetical protein